MPNVPISERPRIRGKEDLIRMYPKCFETQGKHFLDFEYTIKIDPSVKPKPPRRENVIIQTQRYVVQTSDYQIF